MPAVIIDACGVLNLYASGRFAAVLAATGDAWHLPAAVEREAHWYRQPDPADPGRLVPVPIDLTPAVAAGLLHRCDCGTAAETALYVDLLAQIGDDGEAMGLAIAKSRGWALLTDDKKARRVAAGLGVPVQGTPEVMRRWAAAAGASPAEVVAALAAITRFANYHPGRGAADADWWATAVATAAGP